MQKPKGELSYDFAAWSVDSLAGALRAMAFEDPTNTLKLHLLEECASRMFMMDAACRLGGQDIMLEGTYYRNIAISQNKIVAIKKYREDKGVSLKAAKDYIDGLL